jgi:hypothetical protein
MPVPTDPNTLVNGNLADATEVEAKFDVLFNYLNGQVDNDALAAAAEILGTKLASSHREKLGVSGSSTVRRGASIISAGESLSGAAYAFMPTPDRVQNIVLPSTGFLEILYHARWSQTVSSAAAAAIFLNGTQLKVATENNATPVNQEASMGTGLVNNRLTTSPVGIGSSAGTSAGMDNDVTTGQSFAIMPNGSGGVCRVFAAAGTYEVGVKFKANSGNVSAGLRRLYVVATGF